MGIVDIVTTGSFLTLLAVIVFASVFTVYVLFKHYTKTKIQEYLVLMVFYLGAIVNAITNAVFTEKDPNTNSILRWEGRLLLAVSAIFTWYALYLHGARLRWSTPPKWLHYFVSVMVLGGIVILGVKVVDLDYYQNNLQIVDIYYFNFIRIITGLVPLYAYLRIDVIDKGKHIFWTRIGYGSLSLIQFLIGFLNILISVLADFNIYSDTELESIVLTQSLVGLFAIIVFPLLFFITIFYPESLLISYTQIIRVHAFYQQLSAGIEQPVSNHWKYAQLEDYIASLPAELFEKRVSK